MALGHHPALLVWVKQRGHCGHVKARWDIMTPENIQNSWHTLAATVLPLRQPANRVGSLTKSIGFMVGIKGQGDRATRPILPFARAQRPTSAYMVNNSAPV